MGGGNAQKSAIARQRKAEKAAKMANKGSQLKTNSAAQNIVCQICRQTFMCTSTKAKLTEHTDGKHAKNTFEQCFPDFTG